MSDPYDYPIPDRDDIGPSPREDMCEECYELFCEDCGQCHPCCGNITGCARPTFERDPDLDHKTFENQDW